MNMLLYFIIIVAGLVVGLALGRIVDLMISAAVKRYRRRRLKKKLDKLGNMLKPYVVAFNSGYLTSKSLHGDEDEETLLLNILAGLESVKKYAEDDMKKNGAKAG